MTGAFYTRILLEDAGCKVMVATSGADALHLFASHPVDLVLLDYHMPGMNGDVVAAHIKAGQPDVPIALLSADDGMPERARECVDAFVSKSESPGNLLRIVEHLLDLRFLFAPLDGLTDERGKRAAQDNRSATQDRIESPRVVEDVRCLLDSVNEFVDDHRSSRSKRKRVPRPLAPNPQNSLKTTAMATCASASSR